MNQRRRQSAGGAAHQSTAVAREAVNGAFGMIGGLLPTPDRVKRLWSWQATHRAGNLDHCRGRVAHAGLRNNDHMRYLQSEGNPDDQDRYAT